MAHADPCPHCASPDPGTRFAMPTGYFINGGYYCSDPWHDDPAPLADPWAITTDAEIAESDG